VGLASEMRLGHFRRKRKGDALDTGPLSLVIDGGLPVGGEHHVVRFMALGRRVRVSGGLDPYAPTVWPLPDDEQLAALARMYARAGGHVPFDAQQTAEADALAPARAPALSSAEALQLIAANSGPGNEKPEGIPLAKGP
jgi:hypothetical protein